MPPTAIGHHHRSRRWAGLAALLAAALVAGGWMVTQRNGATSPPPVQAYAQEALKALDRGYYAQGAAWDEARQNLQGAAGRAEVESELHEEIRAATTAAGGTHSRFYTRAQVEDLKASSQERYRAPTVDTKDGITTVTVPPLGVVPLEQQQEYARTLADGIDVAAPGTCGWVVDLRGNTGGNMYPMLSGLVALLPNGPAMSFRDRQGSSSVVTVHQDGVGLGETQVSVGERQKVASLPVAVLQDKTTGSSGEAVVTVFRGLPHVESFGSSTAGLTSGNEPFFLADGAVINLTTSVYVDRNDVNLVEQPIPVDHRMVPTTAAESAQRWIEQGGCTG